MRAQIAVLAVAALVCSVDAQSAPFISEIHYDNTGADTGEFVEITGPANTDLTGYKLYLYNGAGGATYSPTTTLSGVLDGTAFGAKSFLIPALQNGNPDGLALVSPAGAVLEFLSYGGVFTATSGPAINTVSKDIGVTEPSTAAIGSSVRKTGDARLSPGTWQFGTASAGTLNSGLTLTPPSGGGGGNLTPIYTIQGSGTASPLAGTVVRTRGVVTLRLPSYDVPGFIIQDITGDGSAATSDGIFVVLPAGSTMPAVGAAVFVKGTVEEYFALTRLSSVTEITLDGTAAVPAAAPLPNFTVANYNLAGLEQLEGMRVTFSNLAVADTYTSGRYGELGLTSSSARLFTCTQTTAPGTACASAAAPPLLTLSDNYGPAQNAVGALWSYSGVRSGNTVSGTGVVSYAFGKYALLPDSSSLVFNSGVNAPPAAAGRCTGTGCVRVAFANVLNLFTTLDVDPSLANTPRGANSNAEFATQIGKIVKALTALGADVMTISELENNYYGNKFYSTVPAAAKATCAAIAAQCLVDKLNAEAGSTVYAYIKPASAPPTDVIANGIIYRIGVVTPVGAPQLLTYTPAAKSRDSLIQEFQVAATGKRFTVAANHLKSKGSACTGDADANDGQGNCSGTRTQHMQQLTAYLNGLGRANVLALGDMNSYAKEDPISAAAAAGFADLSSLSTEYPRVWSYVFSGASGTLDYCLANAGGKTALGTRRIVHYHINADEPIAKDYNQETCNCASCSSCAFKTISTVRASDHDPLYGDFIF